MRLRPLATLLVLISLASITALGQQSRFKVLAFYSATAEGDHVEFARQAVKFLEARAVNEHFRFESTTRWEDLNDQRLKTCQLVIWLNESPTNAAQRQAFERYMEHGGAWLGFHAAGYNDKDTHWPWFVDFLGGAVFYTNSWPPLPARLTIDDRAHPVTAKLPSEIESPANEWYIWRPSPRLNRDVRVLVTFDPSNYPLGFKDVLTSGDLPVVWTNQKYKMLYMNMGHGDKVFASPVQNQLIDNAVNWLGAGGAPESAPEANGILISPHAVALNPQTGKFYAVNTRKDTVNVLDGDGKFVGQINVGKEPVVVAINPNTQRIYVANTGSGTVTVIDGSTDRTVANVAVGDLPYVMGVNPATNKIYVAKTFCDVITAIDGKTNTTSFIKAGFQANAMAVDSTANKIYLTNNGPEVAIIDGATENISKLAAGVHIWAIAADPAAHKIYATSAGDSNVAIIDGKSMSIRHVSVGQFPCTLAIDPSSGRVFATNYASNTVTVVDGTSDSVVATVDVDAKPQAIAVDSVLHRIYVVSPHSGTTTILDGTNNTVLATVKTAGAPYTIAVNSKTHKAIAVGMQGELTVIDGTTFAASSPSIPITETTKEQ